jgi:hypothetical protein
LGQKQDYSAAIVVERPLWLGASWHYLTAHTPQEANRLLARWRAAGYDDGPKDFVLNVIHVQRWGLGSPYPQIVADTEKLVTALQQAEAVEVKLIVDATGVGQPIIDLLADCRPRPIAATITGGTAVSVTSRYAASIPKRDLVMSAVSLLESGRLRWPVGIPEVAIMERELKSFQMKYSKNGHETFEAERRAHDDLVLALSMAVWLATQAPHGLGAPAWLIS